MMGDHAAVRPRVSKHERRERSLVCPRPAGSTRPGTVRARCLHIVVARATRRSPSALFTSTTRTRPRHRMKREEIDAAPVAEVIEAHLRSHEATCSAEPSIVAVSCSSDACAASMRRSSCAPSHRMCADPPSLEGPCDLAANVAQRMASNESRARGAKFDLQRWPASRDRPDANLDGGAAARTARGRFVRSMRRMMAAGRLPTDYPSRT